MYGKIFDSMYDGTLAEDWRALITFQQMIVLCDADGTVDMTPTAISRRTGIPIEHIKAGVEILENPDPYTRTEGEDGRRIVRLDDHRPWGWHIVNHNKYKTLQDADTVRAGNRERKKRQREKEKASRPVTAGHGRSRHTDTDTDTDTDTKTKNNNPRPKNPGAAQLTDEKFIQSLKDNPAYKGIDVDVELAKMDAWLSTRPKRKKTRRFVVNWLNNCDRPVGGNDGKQTSGSVVEQYAAEKGIDLREEISPRVEDH